MDLGQINQLLADYDGEIEGVLAGIPDEELVGAFRRNPRAMRKVIGRNRIIPRPNSRHELAKRMSHLKSDVRGGLANRQLQSVESGLFVIKSISNKQHVKMLQDSDNKETGFSMINGRRTYATQWYNHPLWFTCNKSYRGFQQSSGSCMAANPRCVETWSV